MAKRNRVIDLVKEAGIDTSRWDDVKGGRAAANPKYCYDWSFIEPAQVVVLNLWEGELSADHSSWEGNVRERARGETNAQRRQRALNMDHRLLIAYTCSLPIRVIVWKGTVRTPADPTSKSRVKERMLDPQPWAITDYDVTTGDCIVKQGAVPIATSSEFEDEQFEAFEGLEATQRRRLIAHRKRDARYRKAKLEEMMRGHGRLVCEVPNCGFDFAEPYGKLGDGFAHVHHLDEMARAPKEGRRVNREDLDRLRIVCANCHAIIHRGGECRPLEGLIPNNLVRPTRDCSSQAKGPPRE